ncbi:MAG: hypothetical protein ABEJ73_01705 [Haloplanus sp.]
MKTIAAELGEEAALDDARAIFEAIRRWLERADETPLRALGFDALRERHARLDDHLERCETHARERQEFLGKVTSKHARTGLGHRCLAAYLYEAFPVDHPVLSGVATLTATCERCQRTVRAHLTRCG